VGKVRVGIIGAGSAGLLHALSYSLIPGKAQLVAVCDVNENAAKGIAKAYKADRAFTDYRKMLEQKDIEAVSVCLPHFLHAEVTEAAAEEGKHVLCEKPMATTLKECDGMINTTKRAGVKLMIAENHRWTPAHIAMKEALDQGRIGDVKSVYCWTSQQMIKLPNKAEDTAMMFLKFEKGAVADLFLSFAPIAYFNNSFELYGTHGTILEDHAWSDPVRIFSTKPGKESYKWITPKVEHQPHPGYYRISFRLEVEHFMDCILQDKNPDPSGEDGKAAVEIALLGYYSARIGREIGRGEVELT